MEKNIVYLFSFLYESLAWVAICMLEEFNNPHTNSVIYLNFIASEVDQQNNLLYIIPNGFYLCFLTTFIHFQTLKFVRHTDVFSITDVNYCSF